jgi:hypothetical protein
MENILESKNCRMANYRRTIWKRSSQAASHRWRKWCSRGVCITLCLSLSAAVNPVLGVTIFERGKTEPTRGRLVKQSATEVVITESTPSGSRERTIARTNIEDLIDPIDPARLVELSPEQPQAYRNYAEELAEKRIDPDAQAAAIRLYLIAGYLSPEKLAKSCLLGMTALARSPAEEQRFRAMAYLYDSDHDRRLLRTTETSATITPVSDTRAALLRALQLRRQGNRRAALLNVNRPDVQEEFARFGDVLTFEEFSQVGLSDDLVKKIVALELALETGEARQPASVSWSQIERSGATTPIPALSLTTIAEFDPRQCVFREGAWVAP